MSTSSTLTKTSIDSSSKTVSAKSTATNFGTCQASIPSTCKASSTPKSSSTYFITKPTGTHTPSGPSSTASPTSALTNASLNHSSGLSTGAKAGVGVGVAAGVVVLLALLAFLIFSIRKRRASTSPTEDALEDGDAPAPVAGPAYEKQRVSGSAKEVDS